MTQTSLDDGKRNELRIETTPIPGLLLLSLPVHEDNRGWFKENWQRAKMVELGLPDFQPVQNNVSYNERMGTTRGIHAEPWDKFVTVDAGRIFGAWVDLRAGAGFGTVFTAEVGANGAVFVPRGVGNAYQTLADHTVYSYLVNAHWSPRAHYTSVNLADPALAIDWPIALDRAELSAKDGANPVLAQVKPVAARKTLVLGAAGQLGRALTHVLPDAQFWTHADFDIADPAAYATVDWQQYDTIINAAAYTNVDAAESPAGRREAWRVNVSAVVELAKVAAAHGLTLVQVSSDYVFDGESVVHGTHEEFSPLGVYGQTKAAGDAVVRTVARHYIVRTSWVVGDGPNFVDTMRRLAERGVDPQVVDDQVGLLTDCHDLAAGIVDLLAGGKAYGTYNITSGGAPRSWYDIARQVFADAGHDPDRVHPVSTAEYGHGKSLAPRPKYSTLE